MIKKTTIVTALFDIGRDKWENYAQSYHTYQYWMKNILNFENEMVIFTEDKFKDFILENRKKADPELIKTKIVVQDFQDIDSYKKYYSKIKNLMNDEVFKSKVIFKVPEMTKPEYNTVIFNKLYFIKYIIDNKLCDSDFFIWCDAGVIRDEKKEVYTGFPNLDKINEKFSNKVTFFSHQENFSIHNRDLHLLSQYRYIHGGCFFIPNNGVINELIERFDKLVEHYLNNKVIGSEEKILDFCFLDNKDNYNIVKSDWRQYFDLLS
jgi:hypothetical protein